MNSTEYNRLLAHAGVLLEQSKFQQAHEKLVQLIQMDPNDPDLIKMLIISYLGMGQFEEVEYNARQLIKIMPEDSFAFYALANAALNTRNLQKAEEEINEAIRIHPFIADYFALKANILYQKKDYAQAIETADTGLRIDPENVDCLNVRASAQVALGRNEEAHLTISKALNSDPSNPNTHANLGWTNLGSGQVNEALLHFKTALTEDPLNEYAKAGMLQAMKARFPLYRYFLQLMIWVSKLSNKHQWYLIIGTYIAYRLLLILARNNESLQPYLIPVVVLMVFFFLTTWLFSPLMNLYMLTNPYGKLTMSPQEKESARYVGIALVSGLIFVGLYFLLKNPGLLSTGIGLLLMMIPLGSMNNAFLDSNRKKLRRYSFIIVAMVISGGVVSVITGEFINIILIAALLALVGYQWYTNYVLIKE